MYIPNQMKTLPPFIPVTLSARLLPLLLMLALAAQYFWYLEHFAINIPYHDDIRDVLQFMSELVRADNWRESTLSFFKQHNDHRTTASRLFVYSAYLAQNEVNFRTLCMLANLAIPMILGLLYLRVREHQYPLLLLLPAALLLFQFRFFEIVLWAQAAFAFFFVFLFGFCCVYTLHKVTPGRFFLAALFAVLASFTLASGQLIWLVGLASLLQQSCTHKRVPIGYALCWSVIGLLTLILWHWNMLDALAPGEGKALFPDKTLGLSLFEAMARKVHFCLVLLGSAVSDSSTLAASITGTVLLALLSVVSAASYKESDLRLELGSWYIVLSAAAITWGRSNLFDADYALSSRYSFPSVLMLALIWLLLALRVRKYQPLILCLGLVMAGIYHVYSYRSYPVLLQNSINSRIFFYNQGRHLVLAEDQSAVVHEATALGLYIPPPSPLPLIRNNGDSGTGVVPR